jgi:hypothetical protein
MSMGTTTLRAQRTQWLIDWADRHDGLLHLADPELLDAFGKSFPGVSAPQREDLFGYHTDRRLVRAARDAYLRGVFSKRLIVGHGPGRGRSVGRSNWSLAYQLKHPIRYQPTLELS